MHHVDRKWCPHFVVFLLFTTRGPEVMRYTTRGPEVLCYTISPPGGSLTVGASTNLFPSVGGITGIFMSTFVKKAIFSLLKQ